MTTKEQHLQLINMWISHYKSNIEELEMKIAQSKADNDLVKVYGLEQTISELRFAFGKLLLIKKSAEGLKN